jgi:hypothetical protein
VYNTFAIGTKLEAGGGTKNCNKTKILQQEEKIKKEREREVATTFSFFQLFFSCIKGYLPSVLRLRGVYILAT